MESRQPLLLGFFLLPSPYSSAPTQFLSVSSEGTDLREGRWGNLDDSLSFLPQSVTVVGSSNSFLLCVTSREDNMTYIICNPVTREFRILPKPSKAYSYVAIAFTCKGDDISLDDGNNHYEVVRVGVPNPTEHYMTMDTETFSSMSGEWTESILNSASPISLVVSNLPALVMKGVFYWRNRSSAIVAYDRTQGGDDSVEVIELPENQSQRPVIWANKLSVSEGKVNYCMSNRLKIKVWVMISDIRGPHEWIMKHKVSFKEMFRKNPDVVCPTPALIGLEGLHPRNSNLLLLLLYKVPYWYNLKNKKLSRIDNCMGFSSLPYEWPSDTFV